MYGKVQILKAFHTYKAQDYILTKQTELVIVLPWPEESLSLLVCFVLVSSQSLRSGVLCAAASKKRVVGKMYGKYK